MLKFFLLLLSFYTINSQCNCTCPPTPIPTITPMPTPLPSNKPATTCLTAYKTCAFYIGDGINVPFNNFRSGAQFGPVKQRIGNVQAVNVNTDLDTFITAAGEIAFDIYNVATDSNYAKLGCAANCPAALSRTQFYGNGPNILMQDTQSNCGQPVCENGAAMLNKCVRVHFSNVQIGNSNINGANYIGNCVVFAT